jgi:stearoyl-CoA desaturase (delta-9 desaturase)
MLHHAHSDTPDDPHSPHHTKSMMHMMLKTYKQYKSIVNKVNSEKEERLHSGCPKWTSLDRFSASSASTVFWASAYIGLYFSLQISPIFYLFLPFHFFMGPIQGAIVNWFGHTLGYQNFSDGDQSKNTLPIDFALMGELYQNNHHHFGSRMNFAHRWFEVDFTYAFALILRRLGIIRFLNTN